MITATREHTISCGHRVTGHESKCRFFHGHNYTIDITCEADALDSVGRVVDFSVIKEVCCEWLESNWDHRFLLWTKDPVAHALVDFNIGEGMELGILLVPFNPTAENMAIFLLDRFNALFRHYHKPVRCVMIRVRETPKCSATYVQPVEVSTTPHAE